MYKILCAVHRYWARVIYMLVLSFRIVSLAIFPSANGVILRGMGKLHLYHTTTKHFTKRFMCLFDEYTIFCHSMCPAKISVVSTYTVAQFNCHVIIMEKLLRALTVVLVWQNTSDAVPWVLIYKPRPMKKYIMLIWFVKVKSMFY